MERLIHNPKLKLPEQLREVMRFKHYSFRTEQTYLTCRAGAIVLLVGFFFDGACLSWRPVRCFGFCSHLARLKAVMRKISSSRVRIWAGRSAFLPIDLASFNFLNS